MLARAPGQGAPVARALAAYTRSEDLIRIGAYQKGADPVLDRALEVVPSLQKFLQQAADDRLSRPATVEQMLQLPS